FSSNARNLKLCAVSRPVTLLICRPPAIKLVKLSMSCAVNGPAGFASASRIAAFSPGSGMITSCASVEAMQQVNAIVAMACRRALRVFTLVGEKTAAIVPKSLWDLRPITRLIQLRIYYGERRERKLAHKLTAPLTLLRAPKGQPEISPG